MCIHGAGGYGHHWANQLRQAKKWGYRVIAVDLPGHGRSEGEAFLKIEDYSYFLESFLTHLEIHHYSLVGHSMGGAIAIDSVLRRQCIPDSLFLLGSSPKFKVDKKLLSEFKNGCKPDFFIKAVYNENVTKKLNKIAAMEFTKTPALIYYNDLLACSHFDSSQRIQTLQVPSFWLFGSSDRLIPVENVIKLVSQIPNTQYKTIKKAGHMPHLEQPEITNTEIYSFLSSLI